MCGYERKITANLRELTRIAFFLRRRALLRLMRANRRFACRLKWAKPIWASPPQESHPLWKNAVKNPPAGFSFGCHSFLFFLGCGAATPARSGPRWRYPNLIRVVRIVLEMQPDQTGFCSFFANQRFAQLRDLKVPASIRK